ncbi:MAG: hypothetical protein COB20_10525, partial [SAR86 cluster bacterium]
MSRLDPAKKIESTLNTQRSDILPFSECTMISPERETGNCYRIHGKVYSTGDAKLVAVRLMPDDKDRSRGGYKRKHTKRSEMDEVTERKSYARSRSVARDTSIQKQLDQMLTLTTREIMEFEDFDKVFKLFLRKMRNRHGKKFIYLAVMEYQKRGALHVHMGINGFYIYNSVRRLWNKCLAHYGLGDGNVDFTKASKFGHKAWNSKNIAEYICKYITKSDVTEFNKKRYWSGGPTVPLVKYKGYCPIGK